MHEDRVGRKRLEAEHAVLAACGGVDEQRDLQTPVGWAALPLRPGS
jgi:hypothetical protein